MPPSSGTNYHLTSQLYRTPKLLNPSSNHFSAIITSFSYSRLAVDWHQDGAGSWCDLLKTQAPRAAKVEECCLRRVIQVSSDLITRRRLSLCWCHVSCFFCRNVKWEVCCCILLSFCIYFLYGNFYCISLVCEYSSLLYTVIFFLSLSYILLLFDNHHTWCCLT